MKIQQFRTPQHPSTQKAHYWDTHELQQFRTPQHQSISADHWGGARSLRFDYGTANNHASMGANHWGGADSLPFDYGTPQHHASMGANHMDGSDSLRYDYGIPQPEFLGAHGYWEDHLPSEAGSPRRTAAKSYWGTVDGRRNFGTPLSPAAFRTKKTPDHNLIRKSIWTPEHPASNRKNIWGTPDRIRQFGTPQHPSAFQGFRTPQHPSQGTNNWGGASPLLARNIPQESLDERYERLNTIRTHDAIFTSPDEHDHDDKRYEYSNRKAAPIPPPNSTKRPRGLLWKWIKKEKDPKVPGDPSKKKKKWFRRFDIQKRWPTGWY